MLTVSTGILGAGDIRFTPSLPEEKLAAIHHLPLGCHNRIALSFEPGVFGVDIPDGVSILSKQVDDVPMHFRMRPFGYDYVVGVTGGRHGDWLERAGANASIDYVLQHLKGVFGNSIEKQVVATNVSAWRSDPWIKGSYSAAAPGHADAREILREPLAQRLFFAGEATHASFYSTCHGAYLSGIDAADAASTLARGRPEILETDAVGGDRAEPGDDDAPALRGPASVGSNGHAGRSPRWRGTSASLTLASTPSNAARKPGLPGAVQDFGLTLACCATASAAFLAASGSPR